MCCVPQAFQGPIKMEKLEYTVERCAQYVRVSGAETFVEDLAAFVPPEPPLSLRLKNGKNGGSGADKTYSVTIRKTILLQCE